MRIDALPAVAKDDAVGLRIDLELEDPATGETKWIDTIVHTAAESYREREFKAVVARNVSTQLHQLQFHRCAQISSKSHCSRACDSQK